MSKTFDIPFQGDASSVFERAKQAAAQSGAQMDGDLHQGTFSAMGIKGSYELGGGNIVKVTINEKPFAIPWSLVETQIKNFFK